MNATQRRRYRAIRSPKPQTVAPKIYDLEVTEWRQAINMAVRTAHVVERSWPIAASMMISDLDLRRNASEAARASLLRDKIESATMAVTDKADAMMRQCWGSLLPRLKVA